MTNRNDYYGWRNSTLTCGACGWSGLGKETSLSESFTDGAEYQCPRCAVDFGFVVFPTLAEAATDPRADPFDRDAARLAMSRHEQFERTKLKSPQQLPDLDPSPTTLAWDEVATEGQSAESVVILHEDLEIWREQSFYENYERFGQVAALLKDKYGSTLVDLIPTKRSWMYLYGDRLSAPGFVDRVRENMKKSGGG